MRIRTDRSGGALLWVLPLLLAACGGNKQEPAASPLVPPVTIAVERLETVKKTVDGSGRGLFLIPASSVVKKDGIEQVFVIGKDSLVTVRWISTGRSIGGRTAVLGGLDEGDLVVATTSPGLREGIRITTVRKERAKEARAHE